MSKSDDGTTRVWDVETGECLEVLEDTKETPEGFVNRYCGSANC